MGAPRRRARPMAGRRPARASPVAKGGKYSAARGLSGAPGRPRTGSSRGAPCGWVGSAAFAPPSFFSPAEGSSPCQPRYSARGGKGTVCKVTVLRFVLSAPAAASPGRGNAGRAAPPCCFLLGESLKRERKRGREREGRAIGGDSGAGRAAAGARPTVDLWEEDGMRNKRTWPAVFRGAGAGCPRWLPEPLDSGRGPAELQWTLPAAGRRAEHPCRRRRRRGGRAARPEPARRGSGGFLLGIAPVTAGCAGRTDRLRGSHGASE